jgi:predicted nucleic acid-binding protein
VPYLIDSDWVIDHLLQKPEATALLASLRPEPVFISIVTYMEAFQGTLRDIDPVQSTARLDEFVLFTPILHFDEAVAKRCARIRESVRGGRVRANRRAHDLMIAATAIEHGLTLVTRNVDDFSDIPGLVIQTA